jgi:hypothetical protein
MRFEKIILDISKEAKKSKNFSKVQISKADKDDTMFAGNIIYIKSKLKGLNDRHKEDYDEFTIGLDKYTNEIVCIYEPNGYDQVISTVDEFKKLTRA